MGLHGDYYRLFLSPSAVDDLIPQTPSPPYSARRFPPRMPAGKPLKPGSLG